MMTRCERAGVKETGSEGERETRYRVAVGGGQTRKGPGKDQGVVESDVSCTMEYEVGRVGSMHKCVRRYDSVDGDGRCWQRANKIQIHTNTCNINYVGTCFAGRWARRKTQQAGQLAFSFGSPSLSRRLFRAAASYRSVSLLLPYRDRG